VGKMNWGDILKAVIPVVVAAIAWLLGEVNGMGIRMTKNEKTVFHISLLHLQTALRLWLPFQT